MKIINQFSMAALLVASVGVSKVYASCDTISGYSDIDDISSISFEENGVNNSQTSSGLRCSGLSVGIFTRTHIRYEVTQLDNSLLNNQTGEKIQINFRDHDSRPINVGSSHQESSTRLFSLFTNAQGDLPFYANIPAGQSVSPGTYISAQPIHIRWYYAVPTIGATCALSIYSRSPGLVFKPLSCDVGNWGQGILSSVNYRIDILPDCRIVTRDVDFGTAAFADAFQPVQTSLGVRCSAKTPYSVGLSNGQNASGQTRRMRNGSNFLQYEVYKNASKERWGNQGGERWSSDRASGNPGQYNGKTQQSYNFTTEILDNPNSNSNTPAGTYTDNITVEVKF